MGKQAEDPGKERFINNFDKYTDNAEGKSLVAAGHNSTNQASAQAKPSERPFKTIFL